MNEDFTKSLKKIRATAKLAGETIDINSVDKAGFRELCEIKSLKQLRIHNTNFSELPDEIKKLENLETLTLNSDRLESAAQLENLKNLKYLYLSGGFKTFPENICKVSSLETLYLQAQEIEKIPREIAELKNLKELSIAFTKLESIPESIGDLQKLKVLNITDNKNLCRLPDEIGKLTGLTELIISSCSLEELPATLGDLTALEELNLDENNLFGLPPTLGKLQNLKFLSIDNNLFELPAGLDLTSDDPEDIKVTLDYFSSESKQQTKFLELCEYDGEYYKYWEITGSGKNVYLKYGNEEQTHEKEIKHKNEELALKDFQTRIAKKEKAGYRVGKKLFPLNLKNRLANAIHTGDSRISVNDITDEIFLEICKIKTLKSLNLDNAYIKSIPAEIKNLTELEQIQITCKVSLEKIPREICELKNLKEINISGANLPRIFEGVGELKNLRRLRLEKNKISVLPDSIGDLQNLEELELNKNNLKELPDSIGKLKKLSNLELRNNQIRKLPDEIGAMESLQELDLYDNQLAALPDSIGNLKNLEDLDLANNSLTALPSTMIQLENLDDLVLRKNNLKLPDDIKSKQDILSYFATGEKTPRLVYEVDPREAALSAAEKENIVATYQQEILSFQGETLIGKQSRDPIISFITGESNSIPGTDKKDYETYNDICEILKPVEEWSFVDRRILAYITQKNVWYRQEDELDRGFIEAFFEWVKRELKNEFKKSRKNTFDKILTELDQVGIRDQKHIITLCIKEVSDQIYDESGNVGSLGLYLLSHYEDEKDFMLEISDGYIWQHPLIGLFTEYRVESFEGELERLLFSSDCAPAGALSYLLRIDALKYEPFLERAIQMDSCLPALMRVFKLSFEYFNDRYYAQALEGAKKTLKYIREIKEKNPLSYFAWEDRLKDGTVDFIKYWLKVFQDDFYPDVLSFVSDSETMRLDIIRVVADISGQKGVGIMGEALLIRDEGDELVDHFKEVFALLNSFDYSRFTNRIWEIAQYKSLKVNKMAAEALARLGDSVLDKTEELLRSKDKKERLAGVLVASHFRDYQEIKQLLENLCDTEKDKTVRRELLSIIPANFDDTMENVKTLAAEGKLNKPLKQWLSLEKLPGLRWKKGESTKVSQEVLRALFLLQANAKGVQLDRQAKSILENIDKTTSDPFALALLELVMENGGLYAKNRVAIAILGALAGPRTIEVLTTAVIKERNLNALEAIGIGDSDDALRALDQILLKYRTKYPDIRDKAEKLFGLNAKLRGVSRDELLDLIIPDFGFEGRYKIFTFGENEYKACIETDFTLRFLNGSGKTLKSTPITASLADKTAIRKLKREIANARKQQTRNLEINLINRRKWSKEAWDRVFLDNPLMFPLGRSLLWGFYQEERLLESFVITKDVTLENAEGKTIPLQNKTWDCDFWNFLKIRKAELYELRKKEVRLKIGLVHPLELAPELLAKWKGRLSKEKFERVITQLDRAVYTLAPENQDNKFCRLFENQDITNFAFDQLGWRRGSVVDAGEVSGYRKVFPELSIEVFVELTGLAAGHYQGKLKKFYFVSANSIQTGSYVYDEPYTEEDERLIPLKEIPGVIYSETVRDLNIISKGKG